MKILTQKQKLIGWVLFRAEGLHNAFDIIKLMFSFDFKQTYILMPSLVNIRIILIFILAILLCGPAQKIFMSFKASFKTKLEKLYQSKIEVFVILTIMILCIFELIASSYNPFIYFRF